MWTLRGAGASPFVRKARIGAALCGLEGRMTVDGGDVNDPADPLFGENPLGKVPALVIEDGTAIYDSRVILEFLDAEAGGGVIIPAAGKARFDALTMQALADGILDAAVLQVYERRYRKPEEYSAGWMERQAGKVARALAALEADMPEFVDAPHVGHIALACALGYLDFRFSGDWRDTHLRLVAWLDDFADKVPSFNATAPS